MSITPPTAPPKKPPAPPPSKVGNGAPIVQQSNKTFRVESGITQTHHKTIIYGPGGCGKTSFAALISECGVKPLFLDLEQGSKFHDVQRIDSIETWDEMRSALHNQTLFDGFDAVVIDSLTKAEELATAWTIQNVKHEKGHYVDSIEGYGFGKGMTHVYETFLQLLGDLDSHHRRGRHIIGIAHECTANVPNPTGEDWLRYEPRLQSPASGKASIRHRVKEWCDHLIYIGFDTAVSKDGKATGAGTRTIYPVELPTWWAKSRSLSNPIPYENGSAEFWKQLLGRTS